MASNELAAILARRRAKAGGDADAQPSPAIEKSSAPEPPTPAPTAAAQQPRSSIAERIARLKAQGGANTSAGVDFSASAPVPRAVPIFLPPQPPRAASDDSAVVSAPGESSGEEPKAEAEDETSRRQTTAERIQRLQGNFGAINVNPFGGPYVIGAERVGNDVEDSDCLTEWNGRGDVCVWSSGGGGYRKPSAGGGSSIMTTGDQYAQGHAMGIAMPGMMGAAVPMPGLAKAGTRIPGMAADPSSAQDDDATATGQSNVSHVRLYCMGEISKGMRD